MSNPRHDSRFERHKAALLQFVSPLEMRGLELGPFDLPFVTPEEGNVEYADHSTTEALIEEARNTEGHSAEFVVPVNHVSSPGTLDGVPDGFDWIAAAHIVQHAPSLIDWLKAVGDRLLPDGILFLVVPDKRYTFDFFRPESTLGKILNDHLEGKDKPGPAEVLDTHFYTRALDLETLWQDPGSLVFDAEEVGGALAIMEQARDQYMDVHCNVFSQPSFVTILNALSQENLIPFQIEQVGELVEMDVDFHCVLRKLAE